ncbi:type II toxin-antitoxin system Phd/YefM family antitoxin [Amycolatopsis alkalitolerans]|uniref:Antitoxin n=1 Tax=Amycolatopsis alkalitolerans TaxID=2547244 RepID=A0A5C4M2P1_9PSEU|nr:type II toxin-antitoxin system Phd/YefM family antitoxin [Amycolatopsis alkalitolerans]TNC25061.1 type II toxin-antitoxin system Phd/YefM family antitoxin [Amycolatopsis alkalitolerans]
MTDATPDHAWSVADAKARLSELIDQVIHDGPRAITRRGEEVAVVVSIEEWHRKTNRSGSLAEFLAGSPLRDSDLEIDRVEIPARDIAL